MGRKFGSTVDLPKVASTPTSPTSGYVSVYAKSDDKVYALTSSGTETEVGGISQTTGDGRYARNTLGAAEKSAALSATTGTCTGDLSAASVFTVTPTGNITLAFSNVPATGTACTATVIVTQGATVRTVTMPTGTKFIGAAAPTQVASKACIFTLMTVDGGTTWYASAGVEQ